MVFFCTAYVAITALYSSRIVICLCIGICASEIACWFEILLEHDSFIKYKVTTFWVEDSTLVIIGV